MKKYQKFQDKLNFKNRGIWWNFHRFKDVEVARNNSLINRDNNFQILFQARENEVSRTFLA